MKKLVTIIIVVAVVVLFAHNCGNSDSTKKTDDSNDDTSYSDNDTYDYNYSNNSYDYSFDSDDDDYDDDDYDDDDDDYDDDYYDYDDDEDYYDDDDEEETEPVTTKPKKKKVKATQPKTIVNTSGTNHFEAHGSGDYVAKKLIVLNYGVLKITHSGKGHFSVVTYDENGEYDDLLVNVTGKYSGNVLVEHSGTFSLEINADGKWTISASGLGIDDSTYFSGKGDCVTGLTSHCGGSWTITHDGKHHFSIVEYGLNENYMDLLVNETGKYSGTVMAPEKDEAVFFRINADGNWTLKKD